MTYHNTDHALSWFTDFNDQSGSDSEELVIPADLTELSDEELTELHTRAQEAFAALFNDGTPAPENMDALAQVTDGLEAIMRDQSRREEMAAERAEAARALAERIGFSVQSDEDEDDEDDSDEDSDDNDDDGDEDDNDSSDEGAGEVQAMAVERRIRAPRRPLPPKEKEPEPKLGVRDIMHATGKGAGFVEGQGIDFMDAARITDQRYARFKPEAFESARRGKLSMKETHPILSITKQFPDDLQIKSTDRAHVDEVISRAVDETRLENGSLVAAGGWCAPSEVTYDLLELETREGLFSLPEVNLPRGGIQRTLGPRFSDLFALGNGFAYTEEQDIDGTYGVDADGIGNGTEGSKPCITLECPDFDDFRLGVVGICVNAGILQQRGYPEAIARSIRGVLVAHDHIKAGRTLADIEAGSTAVTMPSGQVGAASPILTSIELQVEHYRYVNRVSPNTSLEAVFPFWVRGLIRTDFARQEGVDAKAVTNAQITSWFQSRGVNPQFVYNWQDISGDPASFTQWPTTVKFALYAAGTWVRGTNTLITLESRFDSELLANNNYNALFTEEGHLVFNMHHDSRVVSVPVAATGAYAGPVNIAHDGTLVVESEGGAG